MLGTIIKASLGSFLAGMIVLAIVGFNWNGWKTAGGVERAQAEAVENVLATVYGPICVERFNASASTELRESFADASSWVRNRVIRESGFATPDTFDDPVAKLAEACARALTAELEAGTAEGVEETNL